MAKFDRIFPIKVIFIETFNFGDLQQYNSSDKLQQRCRLQQKTTRHRSTQHQQRRLRSSQRWAGTLWTTSRRLKSRSSSTKKIQRRKISPMLKKYFRWQFQNTKRILFEIIYINKYQAFYVQNRYNFNSLLCLAFKVCLELFN